MNSAKTHKLHERITVVVATMALPVTFILAGTPAAAAAGVPARNDHIQFVLGPLPYPSGGACDPRNNYGKPCPPEDPNSYSPPPNGNSPGLPNTGFAPVGPPTR